jgi:hypothetical protein
MTAFRRQPTAALESVPPLEHLPPPPGPPRAEPDPEQRWVVVMTGADGREHLTHADLMYHGVAEDEAAVWRRTKAEVDVREVVR